MKRIHKLLAGLLIVLYVFVNMGNVAQADIIITPDDEFYIKHSSECEELERGFTANGPEGEITLWKSPSSKKKVTSFENSYEFIVQYTYTDKKENQWGFVNTDQGSGWLRMEELVLVYDNIAFCEQHESEFQPYNGEFDDYVGKEPIVLWTYPGSGITYRTISELDEVRGIVYVYTDKEGRQWGNYDFKGLNKRNTKWDNRSSWICLTDPTNKELPVIKYEMPETITAQPSDQTKEVDQIQSDHTVDRNNTSVILYLGIAIIILLVITIILISVFWKKDKK